MLTAVESGGAGSMTSKPVALLLADLGVTETHCRPSVSNDNPYSEAQFKTLKCRPDLTDRFGSLQHARVHGNDFSPWYNNKHRHSGLGAQAPSAARCALRPRGSASRPARL